MIGVGPYIPHPADAARRAASSTVRSSAGEQAPNTELMTYKVVALTRLVLPAGQHPHHDRARHHQHAERPRTGASCAAPTSHAEPYAAALPPLLRNLSRARRASRESPARLQHVPPRGRIAAIGRTVGTGPGGRVREDVPANDAMTSRSAWAAPASRAATPKICASFRNTCRAQPRREGRRPIGHLCEDQCSRGPNIIVNGVMHHAVDAAGVRGAARPPVRRGRPRMNALQPIYTERTECQDCYKCIRECPVKAIKVEGGYASIVPRAAACYCGHCVETCPNGAKNVRDDRRRVRAPAAPQRSGRSFARALFRQRVPGRHARQMVAALRRLGFCGRLRNRPRRPGGFRPLLAQLLAAEPRARPLSSACPVVVDSSANTARIARASSRRCSRPCWRTPACCAPQFGEDIGVVFIGPCIAKKGEADLHPELVDAVLDVRRPARLAGARAASTQRNSNPAKPLLSRAQPAPKAPSTRSRAA